MFDYRSCLMSILVPRLVLSYQSVPVSVVHPHVIPLLMCIVFALSSNGVQWLVLCAVFMPV